MRGRGRDRAGAGVWPSSAFLCMIAIGYRAAELQSMCVPGRLSRRCAELVGEIGEEELYALLREHWLDGTAGDEAAIAEGDDSGSGPYGGLEQLEAVVCTELTSWCGGGKGPKPKKKKKRQSKVQKDKSKNKKQKKKAKDL